MPFTDEISQAAEELGQRLGSAPLVVEYKTLLIETHKQVEIVEIENQVTQLYNSLINRQQGGEVLNRTDLDDYYNLKHQAEDHPLIAARDYQLEIVKTLFARVDQRISDEIGFSFSTFVHNHKEKMSRIAELLSSPHSFAVVGASQDTNKYGYELFKVLIDHGHTILPVNPKYQMIDNQPCFASLFDLPLKPDVVITAAPASASAAIAQACAQLGVSTFWMPTGTESEEAIEICQSQQIHAIYNYCPVFVLKLPRERWSELP